MINEKDKGVSTYYIMFDLFIDVLKFVISLECFKVCFSCLATVCLFCIVKRYIPHAIYDLKNLMMCPIYNALP